MNKVYEIAYAKENYASTIKIRACDNKEALRIAKKMTGVLIKNMSVICEMGYSFKADNDF